MIFTITSMRYSKIWAHRQEQNIEGMNNYINKILEKGFGVSDLCKNELNGKYYFTIDLDTLEDYTRFIKTFDEDLIVYDEESFVIMDDYM